MRQCPACHNSYSDDAKFCPMDATILPPPEGIVAGEALRPSPTSLGVAPWVPPPAVTQGEPQRQPIPTEVTIRAVLGGRFQLQPEFQDTPTGRLHEAADLQEGGARAWVKLVPASSFPSPILLDRSLRELRQLTRVTSPRVMKIIGFGKTPEGELYVAFQPPPPGSMELDEAVQRAGLFDPERARAIIVQIGDGLGAAHQVGVVHRNIAPHAVYLSPDDQVLIVDFAVTEVYDVKGRMVQGSPYYLSPEQAQGKSVDQRSTIYSLAAIYYYLLTGTPPVGGNTLGEVLQQVTDTAVIPASMKRPGLPQDLDRLLSRALEKVSGRRQLTLQQFLNQLEEMGSFIVPPSPRIEVVQYRPATSRTMTIAALGAVKPDGGKRTDSGDAGEAPQQPYARTLIGLPSFPMGTKAGTITPAALGAAFSAGQMGEAEEPATSATAVEMKVHVTSQLDEPDDSATIPMPRMSEEEIQAHFGLEVPLRSQQADLSTRSTMMGQPAFTLPAPGPAHTDAQTAHPEALTILGATADETALLPRTQDQAQAQVTTARTQELPARQEPLVNPALIETLRDPMQAPAAVHQAMARASARTEEMPAKTVSEKPRGFRETAWFKKGEIEDYLQDPARPGEVLVTPEDHARLSLRNSGEKTGEQRATATGRRAAPAGKSMSEKELLAEMRGKSPTLMALLVAVAVMLLGGFGYLLLK